MILCFELSMPGVASWNGKWSGEGSYYAIVKNLGKSQEAEKNAKEILSKGYFTYHWTDGWSAGVKVRAVDAREAAKARKKSRGFWGYDWMVDSIISDQEII